MTRTTWAAVVLAAAVGCSPQAPQKTPAQAALAAADTRQPVETQAPKGEPAPDPKPASQPKPAADANDYELFRVSYTSGVHHTTGDKAYFTVTCYPVDPAQAGLGFVVAVPKSGDIGRRLYAVLKDGDQHVLSMVVVRDDHNDFVIQALGDQ